MATSSAAISPEEIDRRLAKRRQVATVFTPAHPVTQDKLFAGRVQQVARLVETLENPGQHAVLFGEQSVGKTSLAQYVHRRWPSSIYVFCSADDSLDSVIRRISSEIQVQVPKRGVVGFHAANSQEMEQVALSKLISPKPLEVPDAVALLSAISGTTDSVTVFLDEFDRIPEECRRGFSELLKIISDAGVDFSFVIIGIAEDLRTLVADHQSVERNMRQIRMPRMSNEELDQILDRGNEKLELSISDVAKRMIVRLSHGLPYFTHLLALEATKLAVVQGRAQISSGDIHSSIPKALSTAEASLTTQLHEAISGANQDHYLAVLRAAATCDRTAYGSFNMASVRAAYRRENGQASKDVSSAVDALCRAGRGPVLVTSGSRANRLFRFKSPLFESYVDIHWQVEKLGERAR